MKSCLLILIALISIQAFAFDYNVYARLHEAKPDAVSFVRSNPALALSVSEGTIEQPLSHFNPNENRTFTERYFYSTDFASGPDAPVILYICGEWRCSGNEISRVVSDYARTLKANVVGIEHRFYGDSRPFSKWPDELTMFQYLNTRETMADIMEVQKKVSTQLSLTGKWISFGCSYGGTLATYLRADHPDQIAGAIAFSAPTKTDETGIPEFSIASQKMYGDRFAKEIGEIAQFLSEFAATPEGRARIREKLSLPDDKFSIDDFKNILLVELPELAQYDLLSPLKSSLSGANGIEQKAMALLDFMSSNLEDAWQESPYGVRVSGPFISDAAIWNIQSYLEFKYNYVTAGEKTALLFPFTQTISYYKQSWSPEEQTFGVKSSLKFAREIENKLLTSASNFVFLHGNVDPWSATSHMELQDESRDLNTRVLNGAHCVGYSGSASASDVREARQLITNSIARWSK